MTTTDTTEAPYSITSGAKASAAIDGRAEFAEERFAVEFGKAGKGLSRVSRGLAGTIGYVRKVGALWQPLDLDMNPVTGNHLWQRRLFAGHELALRVPLPPLEWEEQFRV